MNHLPDDFRTTWIIVPAWVISRTQINLLPCPSKCNKHSIELRWKWDWAHALCMFQTSIIHTMHSKRLINYYDIVVAVSRHNLPTENTNGLKINLCQIALKLRWISHVFFFFTLAGFIFLFVRIYEKTAHNNLPFYMLHYEMRSNLLPNWQSREQNVGSRVPKKRGKFSSVIIGSTMPTKVR